MPSMDHAKIEFCDECLEPVDGCTCELSDEDIQSREEESRADDESGRNG